MTKDTSWETSSLWYDKVVGEKGHYYHAHRIIPGVLRLLATHAVEKPQLLDLACGQGILARHLTPPFSYVGLDGAPGLIQRAKSYSYPVESTFQVVDLSHPTRLKITHFTHATCILAVQNIDSPAVLFQTAFDHLSLGGEFIVVLNHPCFRIPRQSSWGVDASKKLQYRRIDRYFSPLDIPIQTHPGKGESSVTTWSFHRPLSHYIELLLATGFVLTHLEEWCSDKKSEGACASMENRSRQEFPLFLTLVAKKISSGSR